MSITDELREYANIATDRDIYAGARLCKIADRIDAAHCKALGETAAAAFAEGVESVPIAVDENAWVRLPVDADGVPICPGDELVISETGERVTAYDLELYEGGRWMVCDDEMTDSINPKRLRHHHAPTVEDVLREFAEKVTDSQIPGVHPTYEEAIAEYAAKLRLAEEVDE